MPAEPSVTSLAIEHVDPASLHPAPYNPRKMGYEERRRLEHGIREFGLVDPIIARRRDRMVIGGHQRLDVALGLGHETVPVVFLDDVSDERAKVLNVLLNNPRAQGEWNLPVLADLLADLGPDDVLVTGFDDASLRALLADVEPPQAPDDFRSYDESIATEHRCPKCGYTWSGKSAP